MKNYFCFCVLLSLLSVCPKQSDWVVAADQVIDYHLQGDQYAIVVAEDGINTSQAKQMARKRAAEITVKNGGRYFVIESEVEAQVVKSDDAWPNNNAFYGNMYQELIVEGNFGKESRQRASGNTSIYPAIRLVFTIYSKKPKGKAVDACSLTDC
jgi:hypothetical protein